MFFGILLVLLLLFCLVGSPIIALIALSRIRRVEERIRELETQGAPAPQPVPAPALPEPTPPLRVPTAAPPDVLPPPIPPPIPPLPLNSPSVPAATPSGPGLESQLGGRAASWIGISLVVLGIGFFVAYAIQRQWLGPEMRIMLGLLAGAGLAAAGYVFERKRLPILSRALTAGGGALMYFSVFAARGMYGLIGSGVAAGGLLAVAAAILALAMLYNSQLVALGALLGAYFVPPLTDSGTRDGIFLLSYIAILNLPVLALGLKRRWQTLYNTSAILTWFAWFAATGDSLSGLSNSDWPARLGFAILFFAQMTVLQLVKLWREEVVRRPLDLARLSLNSCALILAVYLTLEDADQKVWTGGALLLVGLAHMLLAKAARKRLPRFTDDALAFLLGAASCIALALPLQLDGAWVSAGWALEGVLLAWFAARTHSPLLQVAGFTVAVLGWGKAQFFDPSLYATDPRLFLNLRFAAGILSAVSLGIQARLAGAWAIRSAPLQADRIGAIALAAAATLVMIEGWLVLGHDSYAGAAMGALGMVLLAAGALRITARDGQGALNVAARILLAFAAVKVLTYDISGLSRAAAELPFRNMPFFGLCAALLCIPLAMRGSPAPRSWPSTLRLLSAAALVLTVTLEIHRAREPWTAMAITIWWAVAAMILVGLGFRLRLAHLRWAGLALFAGMTAKALLYDLAELRGLYRIAAFLGAGLLLLALSLVYQRISLRLAAEPAPGVKDPA